MHPPTIEILDPLQPAGEMHDAVGRNHLARMSEPAKTRRDVEGRTAKAALNPDRLTRIDPDPNPERQLGIRPGLLLEPHLELDRRTERLARRPKDSERLVSAQFDDRAPARADTLTNDGREPRCQSCSRFVSLLLCEPRKTAYVGDQEGTNLGLGTEE